eukprot:INCI2114.1.p2 GENE.INCI2114.1~~INCI2114.1.p2  ORF type:complete len:179 (-),score=37.47 INCI2114.1:282-818(-)
MDEWPLMSKLAMPKGKTAIVEKQHTTTEQRCAAAEAMRDTYDHKLQPMHLLVDPMDDDRDAQAHSSDPHTNNTEKTAQGEVFSQLLNPWPTRFYIMEWADSETETDVASAKPAGEDSDVADAAGILSANTINADSIENAEQSSSLRRGALRLSWTSFFEPDSGIDFSKFSEAVLSRLE